MPNIAPCGLTRRRGRRSCGPWTLPPIHPRFDRSSPIRAGRGCGLRLRCLIGSLGSVGMWSVVVALPVVQARIRRDPRRGVAGLYAGHARLRSRRRADRQDHRPLRHRHRDRARHRHSRPRLYRRRTVDRRCGNSSWCISPIGLGSSATFGPLMAEASHWFERYRGLAVTIAPAATMSAARSGRRWSTGACSRSAGAPPISRSASSPRSR